MTADFETILHCGYDGLIKRAEKSLNNQTDDSKKEFLKSCIFCLNCFKRWNERYIEKLETMSGYDDNLKNLKNVPKNPATSFYEAVQSLWFSFAFTRLCGNWPGIGRIDVILGDFLKKDLENNVLTLDEAREILAHFFIKGCEWICGGVYGSGDAQHYQNIVLSGTDENGNDVTNEVTYLVLDIVEELGISDFPITVRLNKNSDEHFLKRVAEVISLGGGIVAIYNEELIIESFEEHGYTPDEARRFANDGCWEVQVPGKTNFIYLPFDALSILQKDTLSEYGECVDFENFEELYSRFIKNLEKRVKNICDTEKRYAIEGDSRPCTVISLFENDCIERGLSYVNGGTVYKIRSPHIGGIVDTANSLYAIKKLVFDENKVSFREFMKVLRDNWEDNEYLRQYVKNQYVYYGNDNDEADEMLRRIASDFADICYSQEDGGKVQFPAGISTFGRQIEWAPSRLATPCGNKKGEVLSGNVSPAPGTDLKGATSIIKSYCKIELKKQMCGAALDISLMPSSIKGENGILSLVALLKAFVRLGGFFMQPDVVDKATLLEAQNNPEQYQNLSVRVSGWNARFVTLNKEWQNMVIQKNENGEF